MYNLVCRKPEPFVPRRLRFEVSERVDRHGNVLVPLQLAELDADRRRLPRARASRRSPSASCTPTRTPSTSAPRAIVSSTSCPARTSSISSEITREWREYERTSTAVLNGYVAARRRRLSRRPRRVARGERPARAASTSCSRAPARRRPPQRAAAARSPSSSPGPPEGSSARPRVAEQIGEPDADLPSISGHDREVLARSSAASRGRRPSTGSGGARPSPATRSWCRSSTSSRSAPGAAASRGSTTAERSGSARRAQVPTPARRCHGRGGLLPTVTDAKLLAGRPRPRVRPGGRLPVYPDLARDAMDA